MKPIVFLGPTLSVEDARAEFDATYLPPVAQGDLYRAAQQKPLAIGIVDGYFERLPAVWHKEILWALCHGVHVFGAASMGALRAAELQRFGMRGVGAVYKAFASGELADDDEVTIAHGDADTGYRNLSEAMVNIRATLTALEDRGLLSGAVCQRFVELAKGTFYPDRSYPRLLSDARKRGIAAPDIETLQRFVECERVNQKRLDAIELLRAMRDCVARAERPEPAAFSLAHTEAWDQVVEWSKSQRPLS